MSDVKQNKKITTVGIIFTIVVTVAFLWAANQWFNRYNWPKPLTTKQLRANGLNTFKNLQLIADAQEKYKLTDWDKDGKKTYTEFFTHLWTTVDENNDPMLLDLISHDLAFAIGPYRPKDGYFFVNLPARAMEGGKPEELDPEKNWAIVAVPSLYTKKGAPIFMMDNSGRIFAQKYRTMVYVYPLDPVEDGWEEIKNIQQLKDFQGSVVYTKEMARYPYRYK